MRDKLPSKEFDKYYESNNMDRFQWRLGDLNHALWTRLWQPSFMSKKDFLCKLRELYRRGEIRDDGPYVKRPGKILGFTPSISSSAASMWGRVVEAPPLYKLDPAKFDELVDDVNAFSKAINGHGILTLIPGSVTTWEIIVMYKAGILRQGGPLEVCETCGQEKK